MVVISNLVRASINPARSMAARKSIATMKARGTGPFAQMQHSGAFNDRSFERLIAATKRNHAYAAHVVKAELAKPFPKLIVGGKRTGGIKHLLTKQPDGAGVRITRFDRGMSPIGHTDYAHSKDGIKRVVEEIARHVRPANSRKVLFGSKQG